MNLCVTEATIYIVINAVLSIKQPWEVVAEHHVAVATAEAATKTKSAIAKSDKEKNAEPAISAVAEKTAAIATAETISRCYEHCCVCTVSIVKSHNNSPFSLILQGALRKNE